MADSFRLLLDSTVLRHFFMGLSVRPAEWPPPLSSPPLLQYARAVELCCTHTRTGIEIEKMHGRRDWRIKKVSLLYTNGYAAREQRCP